MIALETSSIITHWKKGLTYQGVLSGLGVEDTLVGLQKGFALQILNPSFLRKAFCRQSCHFHPSIRTIECFFLQKLNFMIVSTCTAI